MKINQLYIQNFKCFKSQNFTFNPQFTVLIGDNTKGKTSALDALAVAIGTYFLGIDGLSQRGIKKDEIRRISNVKDEAVRLSIENEEKVSIQAYGEIDGKQINWTRNAKTLSGRLDEKEAKEIKEIATLHQKLVREDKPVKLPVFAYYSTSRLWGDVNKKVEFKKKQSKFEDGYHLCLEPESNNFAYISWVKNYEYKIKIQEKDETFLKIFKNAITNCVENWTNIYFDPDEDDLVGTIHLENSEKVLMPYRMLSDGQRNVVGLVAELAYRCLALNDHLGESVLTESEGIVLIDEVDLHLHPKWQRRIVSDLKRTFPKLQFIVTTHSPFIIQSLKKSELINLDELSIEIMKNPNEMPINSVITSLMNVKNIHSDNFNERVRKAEEELEKINVSKGKLTLDDYVVISKKLGEFIENETDNPEYKAFIRRQK